MEDIESVKEEPNKVLQLLTSIFITPFTTLFSIPLDGKFIFTTRCLRLFSFGMVSVVLLLYIKEIGLSDEEMGLLLSGILFGDVIISLYITTHADRLGRRRMLVVGALLKCFAGVIFGAFSNIWLLLIGGAIGVISPSGGEIGPFLPVEQAALTQLVPSSQITTLFAYYNFFGYLSLAAGALVGGIISEELQNKFSVLTSYRVLLFAYSGFALITMFIYTFLSSKVEAVPKEPPATRINDEVDDVPQPEPSRLLKFLGLKHKESQSIILKLSLLFMLDAFAGGLVMQTVIVFWFSKTWGLREAVLGAMLLGANVLSGISAILASPLADKIGLIQTMVFTHIPSNIFLLLIPLMPFWWVAVAMLLMRFSISQMDVPARQSYVAQVVQPEERSAAGGITNIVRSVALMASPLVLGVLLAQPTDSIWFQAPFFIAGGLKIIYDVLLFIMFASTKLKTQQQQPQQHQPLTLQEEEDELDVLVENMEEGDEALTADSNEDPDTVQKAV